MISKTADNSHAAMPTTCWHHTAKCCPQDQENSLSFSVTSSCYSMISKTADNSHAAMPTICWHHTTEPPTTCWHHTAKHAVHKIKKMAEVSVTSSCYSTISKTADNSHATMLTIC